MVKIVKMGLVPLNFQTDFCVKISHLATCPIYFMKLEETW